ncbi:hypothetical protein MalM25_33580 [Planctomycetes bacterium MalM25]|nr:hypothetical protein MalM25_33580 [Planctomycetes bacterium MalM25]
MARKATPSKSPTARRNAAPGEHYRLEGTYERLRRALISGPDDGRLDQPLSYWVRPTDRRLPIAFLDRPIRELIEEPLGQLMSTQGVGQKKILGFFDLLRRVIKAESPHTPFGMTTETLTTDPAARRGVGVATADVSEAVWSEWCEAIVRAGFDQHPLGRVAPSLQPLPTVIWNKPLGEYTALSLSEIRSLKTHGEKRVGAILEVFGAVYEAVSTAALHEDLQLDLTARFVPRVSRWVQQHAPRPHRLSWAGVADQVAQPLVEQIEIDRGVSVASLVSQRLGLEGETPSVKAQAERMQVTRARVYQLLEDCAGVLNVRWPEGRWLLEPLAARPGETDPEAMGLIHALRSLFYPV